MSVILGIDAGDARTGIAVSDTSEKMAFGVCTITEFSEDRLIGRIAQIALERKAELIVLGLPVNMDGSKGFRAEKIASLGEKISQRTGLKVEFCDERCSTMMAHKILNETNTRGKKRKQVVDTLSAEIILQSYLDKKAAAQ